MQLGLAILDYVAAVESKSDTIKEKINSLIELGIELSVEAIAESIPIAGILFKVVKALNP